MKRVICFGAGGTAERLYNSISEKYEIVAFVDNQKSKHGTLFGKKVVAPERMREFDYDYIVITSIIGVTTILGQLADMGVDEAKVISSYVDYICTSRVEWLRSLSKLQIDIDKSIEVAEAGVFRSESVV